MEMKSIFISSYASISPKVPLAVCFSLQDGGGKKKSGGFLARLGRIVEVFTSAVAKSRYSPKMSNVKASFPEIPCFLQVDYLASDSKKISLFR